LPSRKHRSAELAQARIILRRRRNSVVAPCVRKKKADLGRDGRQLASQLPDPRMIEADYCPPISPARELTSGRPAKMLVEEDAVLAAAGEQADR